MSKRKLSSIFRASIVLGLGIVAILPQVAQASFSSVHRSTVNGKERVVIPGQTPDSRVEIATVRTAPRSVTMNNCGWGKFTESATASLIAIRSGGVTRSISSGPAPTCVRETTTTGVVFYSTSNTGAIGTVVRDGTTIWVRGGSGGGPYAPYAIEVDTSRVAGAKANACGVASFTVSDNRPLTTFNFNGTNYTLSSLPATSNGGLICRRTQAGAIAFAPLSGF